MIGPSDARLGPFCVLHGRRTDEPEADLTLLRTDDVLNPHVLLGGGGKVRVIQEGEAWPVLDVKTALQND